MAVRWRLFASPFDHNDDDNEKEFTGKEGRREGRVLGPDGRTDGWMTPFALGGGDGDSAIFSPPDKLPAVLSNSPQQPVTFCWVLLVVGGLDWCR